VRRDLHPVLQHDEISAGDVEQQLRADAVEPQQADPVEVEPDRREPLLRRDVQRGPRPRPDDAVDLETVAPLEAADRLIERRIEQVAGGQLGRQVAAELQAGAQGRDLWSLAAERQLRGRRQLRPASSRDDRR
jgi:hypothetical protein